MIAKYVAVASGAAVAVMGVIMYFLIQWGLGEHDRALIAEHANALNKLQQELKADKETALQKLRDSHTDTLDNLRSDHKGQMNDVLKDLATARQDALQKPIEFGDDLIREFIYIDCVWASGRAGNSVQGRATCRSEAERADPTSAGFSFATVTPTFLQRWGEACEKRSDITSVVRFGEEDLAYTEEDWRLEFGNFNSELCHDSLVTFTPEFAQYMRAFLKNGQNYTSELLDWGAEQGEIIDILTKSGQTEQ
jgi:hypothetical protein